MDDLPRPQGPSIQEIAEAANRHVLVPIIDVKTNVRINKSFVSIRDYERLPVDECLIVVSGGPQSNNAPFLFVGYKFDREQSELNYMAALTTATQRKMRHLARQDAKIDSALENAHMISAGVLQVAQQEGVRRTVVTKAPIYGSVSEMCQVQHQPEDTDDSEEAKRIKK
eukprot:PhF_6_TR14781/c0_g1_i1/m.23165